MQLAQVELLGHDRLHLVDRDPQDAAGGTDHGRQVHPLTGQQAHLPEELPRAVGDDHFLVRPTVVLDDLDLPSRMTIRS